MHLVGILVMWCLHVVCWIVVGGIFGLGFVIACFVGWGVLIWFSRLLWFVLRLGGKGGW